MAFTPGSNDGQMNGSTAVTLVAAPASGVQRLVKSIVIQNRDTASITLTVRYVSAGGTRQIWSGTVASGSSWVCDTVFVLDTTGKSITAVLGGAPATTQPDFTTTYSDAS